MIYLVEVDAHNGTSVVTLRFATEGITTKPTDAPANQYYVPRIKDPGNFGRSLFAEGQTRGQSTVGAGDVVLVNGDPGNGTFLDALLNYGFDGRRIVIKTIESDQAPVSGARTLFIGTCEQLVSSSVLEELSLRIHDRLADLDQPLLTSRYAGSTTSTMAEAEGNADIKNQVKPRVWGRVSNVPAVPANIFDLFYQVNDGPVSQINVFDGGVPLTLNGDYASLPALRGASLAPGQYATALSLGLFRLGGSPFLPVTADVVEGATAADRTAAQVARRMLLAGGISAADILTASFTALDAKNSAEVGFFVQSETSILAAIGVVLESVGGWLLSNKLGQFEVGRFEAPSGTPLVTIDEVNMLKTPGLERLATGEAGRGIPSWKVTLRYGRSWLVQDESQLGGTASDGSGPVSAARRSFVGQEYREVTAENAAVKTQHLLAPEMTIDTMLANAADAQAEANRLLALYSVRRDRYRVAAHLDEVDVVEPGSVVMFRHQRLGMSAGRLFTVLGRTDEYAEHSITLDLWG